MPNTREAFLERFTRAYNEGDRDAILSMVQWRNVPDDLRPFAQGTLTASAGTFKITEIELIPWSPTAPAPGPDLPDGAPIIPDPMPQYWLVFKSMEGRERGWTLSVRWHVAEENGRYWLCGPVHDPNAKTRKSPTN